MRTYITLRDNIVGKIKANSWEEAEKKSPKGTEIRGEHVMTIPWKGNVSLN